MRLLSWLDDGVWSASHISHIGEPLCAMPMPEKPQARQDRPAEIRDWPRVCADCRALAIKGATSDDSSDAPVSPAPLTLTERGA